MAIKDNQTNFEQHVKQQLDKSIDSIDSLTQLQLRQIRQKALDQNSGKRQSWHWLKVGVPTVAVAMLAIILIPTDQQTDSPLAQNIPEWVIITETEELDLYNNLEFYQWLDKTDFNS